MLSVIIYPNKSKLMLYPIKGNSDTPVFTGILTLKNTSKGARPAKFRIKRGNREELRSPDEVIKLLRLADRIMITTTGDRKTDSQIKEMLKAYQLDYSYINPCRLCLLSGRYTPLNRHSINFNNEMICPKCAENELRHELRFRGISDKAAEWFVRLLLKTRDMNRVIGMLNHDPKLTRFDVLKACKVHKRMRVEELPIHEKLKSILMQHMNELLPVQTLSVDAGLLEGRNQLIVSATATGKTLIGELAGINNMLNNKGKMLFLVPLVALANQKYEQFRHRYSSIATTSLRIGTSRIMKHRKDVTTSLSSDIIVATYEAMDYVLRSGNAKALGNIGSVVIDEVHMLEDRERGHRLDGLIARLKFISPHAQFIYLSATVSRPEWLAKKLGAELIEFEERPVPIERHILFVREHEKRFWVEKLAKQEYNRISSKGYRGQTIVFTNSRRRCHILASTLGIRAMPYHAGLSYQERKRVEELFERGKLPVVVTTAALAAGVDFPASQVIFESLAMGMEWLSVKEFYQMLGRAGRPDYHDRGLVYLLVDPDKRLRRSETEDEVAFRLLEGELEHVGVSYGDEEMLEETLSNIIIARRMHDILKINELLLGEGNLEYILSKLKEYGFIEENGEGYSPTRLGSIVASHFLNVEQTFLLKKAVFETCEPMDILTQLETLDNVYFQFSDTHLKVFDSGLSIFSPEVFSGLNKKLCDALQRFAKEFMTCKCKHYCECAERAFSAKVIDLFAGGLSPSEITEYLKQYAIHVYEGDVFNYLDNAARNLEAIELIAGIYGRKELMEKARELRKRMENA